MTQAKIVRPPETLRKRRGHNFYPPLADLKRIPGLYKTERIADPLVHLHYFGGAFDWYVTELDVETFQAFGLVVSMHAPEGELGYFDLTELETLRVPKQPLFIVERDKWWDRVPLKEVRKKRASA